MTEDVARVVALAWGAEAAPQRGPKRELSLERIVEAAIEIADAEGLQAVTMQRVAKTFGYTTMAMYRYVANKDDLQRLMTDAANAGSFAVEDEHWRTGLEQWAKRIFATYEEHPWLLDMPVTNEWLFMPASTRATDTAMRAMRTLSASSEEKLLLLMTLSTFVRGHASFMREMSRPDAIVSDGTKALIRDAILSGSYPDLAPLVASEAYLVTPADTPDSGAEVEEDLLAGLRVWFEGVEAVYGNAGEVPVEVPMQETPEQALAAAEHELAAVTQLRKATQKRVRELEKREAAARKARETAKVAAKQRR